MSAGPSLLSSTIERALERRVRANRSFFDSEAAGLARCCHQMAERFAAGGRLLAVGRSAASRTDVRHVAVEFVHPVIVGKRALPALGLATEGEPLIDQVELIAERGDILIAFGVEQDPSGELANAVRIARARGCLTIAFAPAGAEWTFEPPDDDPLVRQELIETLYHVLWELVHVFFDHRGLLSGRAQRPVHDSGESSFLYPFLGESEHDLDQVTDDVRRSALAKAAEVSELRAQTLAEGSEVLLGAAAALRRRLDAGGRLLACGNGGSATDAADLVADMRHPPPSTGWPRRAAIDLTEDPSILTAIANDVGVDRIFSRQVIAYARPEDMLIAFSTSGSSENLIAALVEARRRGAATLAMVGYDGGRIADESLADHVVVSRSQHIPRIQEAQASAYHVLRELIEAGGP